MAVGRGLGKRVSRCCKGRGNSLSRAATCAQCWRATSGKGLCAPVQRRRARRERAPSSHPCCFWCWQAARRARTGRRSGCRIGRTPIRRLRRKCRLCRLPRRCRPSRFPLRRLHQPRPIHLSRPGSLGPLVPGKWPDSALPAGGRPCAELRVEHDQWGLHVARRQPSGTLGRIGSPTGVRAADHGRAALCSRARSEEDPSAAGPGAPGAAS